MPQHNKQKLDQQKSPPVGEPGLVAEVGDAESFDLALDAAMDYRGDITLTRRSGETIEGFLYDRKRHDDPAQAAVRLLPADGSPRLTIPIAELERVEFTGKDTASGRSFETWMKKYAAKKLAGEQNVVDD